MTHQFTMLFRSPAGLRDWRYTPDYLALLTQDELRGLCHLMGISHSGTKDRQIERILTAREVRLLLAAYEPDEGEHFTTSTPETRMVERLAAAYSGAQLHDFCRRVGAYPPSTKYGKAAALLQWRNECRVKGQKALTEARTAAQLTQKEHDHDTRYD